METGVGEPRIGQWYRHLDKGEIFQVTGLDQPSATIEIQSFDGDLDEIEQEAWAGLPLALAEAPEDWTGPVDASAVDPEGETSQMSAADWADQLQPRAAIEEWGDMTDRGKRVPEDEGPSEQDLALGLPGVSGPPA